MEELKKEGDSPINEETQTAKAAEFESLPEPAVPQPTVIYRWDWEGQRKKEKRSGGALAYAIIMTIAFAVCLTLLLGVVLMEDVLDVPSFDRTIFVREYDSESGVLTTSEIANKVKPSVVGIVVNVEGGRSTGTGIILSEDGYIATNYHVIEDGVSISVLHQDKKEYLAEVVGYDELSDLALIKISASGLRPAEIGNSDTLIEGELAVAIGTPAGIEYAGTVTQGVISGINRDVKLYDDEGIMVKRMTLIQTDASVNPGNSGGPLINEYGQVIGVITLKLGNNYDNIGFAIPINGAMAILEDIKQNGSVGDSSGSVASKRALIGITGGGIEAGQKTELADGRVFTADIDGVVVIDLTEGLDAKTKLRLGDIIVEVDGISVATIYDVMNIINEKYGGDKVTLKYYRDGVYYTAQITLGTEK